ncbi:metal-dependent hydrolase [Marinimicrobium sp. ABcell2]|uniref:metal-dependent hydrolase n=1 Tax=Marinimicrobium sp. ABcell2 TaxID=3069751 RepID=UPI0027B4097B|nr:metal-dependent hydrolase [Marinimicrobium sp. ABcell2]MDQ2076787.1 metal-dependent hydrolase [Marinimicrobium sp. ABcell2]
MDLFTHAGLGALCALSTPRRHKKISPWALVAAVGGALFPDVDFALFFIDPLAFHAYWHRSFTHSLIMLPLWGALVSSAVYVVSGRQQSWRFLYAYACLGVLSHILADLITAWDLQLLWPISDWRLSLGWVFVIDPWFSSLLLLGLLLAWRWPKAVGVSWLLLALWLGWLIVNKQEARHIGHEFAAKVDEPIEVEAWPQPFSPLNWKLIVSTEHGHWQAHAHLRSDASPLARWWPHPWLRDAAQAYEPLPDLSWHYHPRFSALGSTDAAEAVRAWNSDALKDFRFFAHYPARVTASNNNCYWFTDLLYVIPTQHPPFVYGACRTPDGQWESRRQSIW